MIIERKPRSKYWQVFFYSKGIRVAITVTTTISKGR